MQEKKKIVALSAMTKNYNAKLDDDLLDFWLELLDGYSAEHVGQAVKSVIKAYEYKTLPPFAVIQAELDKLTGQDKEAKKNAPFEAWEAVQRELDSSPNREKCPNFEPRILYALKLIGGWYRLCNATFDDLVWRKKEFCTAYGNALDTPLEFLEIPYQERLAIEENQVKNIGNSGNVKALVSNLAQLKAV